MPGYDGREGVVQDQNGIWWFQDPMTGSWSFWNGQDWQKMPDASPRIVRPQRTGQKKAGRAWPCLLTFFLGSLIALIVVGGILLVAYNFFPDYYIRPGLGNPGKILRLGGAGLFGTLLGIFMLYRGFGTIFVRDVAVDGERPARKKKIGCSTILNSTGQLFFGSLFLAVGLGAMTVVFFQEVLPWLEL